jgi:hypothetical protein
MNNSVKSNTDTPIDAIPQQIIALILTVWAAANIGDYPISASIATMVMAGVTYILVRKS